MVRDQRSSYIIYIYIVFKSFTYSFCFSWGTGKNGVMITDRKMTHQDSTLEPVANKPTRTQLWSTTEAVVDSGALEALVNCLEEFDPSVKVAWEKRWKSWGI